RAVVPRDVVPRPAADAPERRLGLRAGPEPLGDEGPRADRSRRLRPPPDLLPPRPPGPAIAHRRRGYGDADADRPLLRQPAPRSLRHARPLRPGCDRDLRLLERPHGMDAGRPRGDPRDERAVVDRP